MAKPLLITRRTRAGTAVDHWRRQYIGEPGSRWQPSQQHADIYARLLALGPDPEPEAVDRAIGNESWTDPGSCDGCKEKAPALVRVGEEPDYESSTAALCRACLREAMSLLPEGDPNE
jgi:hypothetical protein